MARGRTSEFVAIGLIAGAACLGGGLAVCGYVPAVTAENCLAATALLVAATALAANRCGRLSVEASRQKQVGCVDVQSLGAVGLLASTLVVILTPDAYWLVTGLFVSSACTAVLRMPVGAPVTQRPDRHELTNEPASGIPRLANVGQRTNTLRFTVARSASSRSVWMLLLMADLVAMVVVLAAARTFQSNNPFDWSDADALDHIARTNPAWLSVLAAGFVLAAVPRLALFPAQAWMFGDEAASQTDRSAAIKRATAPWSSCLSGGLLALTGVVLLSPVFSWFGVAPEIRTLVIGLSALSTVTAASIEITQAGSGCAFQGMGAAAVSIWLAAAASGAQLADSMWVLPVLLPILAAFQAISAPADSQAALPASHAADPVHDTPRTWRGSLMAFGLIVAALAVASSAAFLWKCR